MHTAFLLAAGLGTRLRPLTLVKPKALLPVCGVPMLDYALAAARAHGHERMMVNAHHLWEQVAAWAVRNRVEVQVELPNLLGTGGGLYAARSRLDPSGVVVLNADVLSDVDLSALRAAVPEHGAALALRPSPDAAKIRAVEADEAGFIVHMADIAPGSGGVPGTHFTGVHALTGAAIARAPDPAVHGESCIIRTAYKAMMPERLLRSIVHRGTWVDIGAPDTYLRANLDALDGRLRLPLDPFSRGSRGPEGAWIGADAQLDGEVAHSVIGARARVPGGARLRDCVVWDDAVVPEGEHEGAVFYGRAGAPTEILQVR